MQLKVSELARRAGVTADTVRYYTRQGILHPERDQQNDYQLYNQQDLQRLNFVRKARQLGFTLKDIMTILEESENHHSPCPTVRTLFEDKLRDVEQRIAELQQLREHMHEAMAAWQKMPDCTPDGNTICQLIEHWEDNHHE